MENTIMPVGEIQGPVLATSGGTTKVRRKDIVQLPGGLNVGIIYGLVHLGTHRKQFPNKPAFDADQFWIGFEHPQLKQFYYEDDTKPRSAATRAELTNSVADKATLSSLIHVCNGNVALSYDDRLKFDLRRLLGNILLVDITLKPDKKDPSIVYETPKGFYPLGAYPMPMPFEPELEQQFFFIDKDPVTKAVIGNNFKTMNYAKLPFYLRKIIRESNEAKEYEAKGGQFAELPREDKNNVPAPPIQDDPNSPVTMLVHDYTYAEDIKVGWTAEALVAKGMATWKVQAPAPQAPQVQHPQAPAPQAPQAPQVQQSQPQAQVQQPQVQQPQQQLQNQTPQQAFGPPQQQAHHPQMPAGGGTFLESDESDVPF